MAALGDGGFKTFMSRRKAEYCLRFPFLTERQISAKLRRVWEFQKGSRASKCRKREPGMHNLLCHIRRELICSVMHMKNRLHMQNSVRNRVVS